ncbi:hypothetical protein EBU71_07240 [bacterium]|jgi:hypothetical protein|nr:hypothetical protein [Candidatus Elulimicrobium humile]
MNTKEVISILQENILETKDNIFTKFERDRYLSVLSKQIEILNEVKQMLTESADKQEIFKMGLIIISLSYMVDDNVEMPSTMIN